MVTDGELIGHRANESSGPQPPGVRLLLQFDRAGDASVVDFCLGNWCAVIDRESMSDARTSPRIVMSDTTLRFRGGTYRPLTMLYLSTFSVKLRLSGHSPIAFSSTRLFLWFSGCSV
jgi:hypothetical protein